MLSLDSYGKINILIRKIQFQFVDFKLYFL